MGNLFLSLFLNSAEKLFILDIKNLNYYEEKTLKFILVFRNCYYLFAKERIIKIICFQIEKQKQEGRLILRCPSLNTVS